MSAAGWLQDSREGLAAARKLQVACAQGCTAQQASSPAGRLACPCSMRLLQGETARLSFSMASPTRPPAALACPRRQRLLDRKLLREKQRIRRMEAQEAAAAAAVGGKKSPKEEPKDEPPSDDDEGIDEDDLIASTAGMEQQQQQQQGSSSGEQQPGGFQPPSVLASASLGLSRASVVLHRAFAAAALRAPQRRCLTRPQRQ